MIRYGEIKRLMWKGAPSARYYVRVSRLDDEGHINQVGLGRIATFTAARQ